VQCSNYRLICKLLHLSLSEDCHPNGSTNARIFLACSGSKIFSSFTSVNLTLCFWRPYLYIYIYSTYLPLFHYSWFSVAILGVTFVMMSLSIVAVRDVVAITDLLCDKAAVPRDTMNGTLLYIFYSCILLNTNSCFMCSMIVHYSPTARREMAVIKLLVDIWSIFILYLICTYVSIFYYTASLKQSS